MSTWFIFIVLVFLASVLFAINENLMKRNCQTVTIFDELKFLHMKESCKTSIWEIQKLVICHGVEKLFLKNCGTNELMLCDKNSIINPENSLQPIWPGKEIKYLEYSADNYKMEFHIISEIPKPEKKNKKK